MEYGSSVDAVTKLALVAQAATRPLLLLHTDQAGVLHAPHAQGRSFLHECGLDAVVVPVHTPGGAVDLPTAAALAVNTPLLEEDVASRLLGSPALVPPAGVGAGAGGEAGEA
jgi:hypothetical protein